MREFDFGPFTYTQTQERDSLEGRIMCAWQLSYKGDVISTEFIRSNARISTIQEVFEAKRNEFVSTLKGQAVPSLKFGWIAQMLPPEVLSLDSSKWKAPNLFELRHIVGIGSLTGITVEQAANLVGVSAVNFRKYVAKPTAKNRSSISFSSWHMLLERLEVHSISALKSEGSPKVVCAAFNTTLELANEISQYLKRLPFVPMTRDFIVRVDNHLANSQTIAAQRLSEQHEMEHNARKNAREAVSYTAAGFPIIKAVVQGDRIDLGLAVDRLEDYDEETLRLIKRAVLMQLRTGIQLELKTEKSN